MVANHFLESRAADGYDTFRPHCHPLVFGRLSELAAHRRFDRALDVACGTGQASVAMAATGTTVVGLDASAAMLRHARRRGVACRRRPNRFRVPTDASTLSPSASRSTEEDGARWLLDTLEPLFSDPRARFRYDGALTLFA